MQVKVDRSCSQYTAFCAPQLNFVKYARLVVTIYADEVMALTWRWNDEIRRRSAKQSSCYIERLAEFVKDLNSESMSRPDYVEIKESLHGINREVKFCWLPSHVNIAGNEQADKLNNMA